MRADGWNGQSVRAHVEHAASVGSQAATDVAELRDELEDERGEMKDRLASAETAAADALTLAQRACDELAELRRSGGAAAPSVPEAEALAAEAEVAAQGRDWCDFLGVVEDVAGSAALAIEAVDTLHIELAELKGRAVKGAASGVTQAGNEMKRRLAEAEAATLAGLEVVKRASDALEALAEFLAALEAQAEGKRHD